MKVHDAMQGAMVKVVNAIDESDETVRYFIVRCYPIKQQTAINKR
jgi:hypothetical protein